MKESMAEADRRNAERLEKLQQDMLVLAREGQRDRAYIKQLTGKQLSASEVANAEERKTLIGRMSISATGNSVFRGTLTTTTPNQGEVEQDEEEKTDSPVPSHHAGRLTMSPQEWTTPANSRSLPISSPPPPPRTDHVRGDDSVLLESERNFLLKSIHHIPQFTGDPTVDKTPDAIEWASELRRYFDLYIGTKRKGLIGFVHHRLKGAAGQWMTTKREVVDRMLELGQLTQPMEWYEVEGEFIRQFNGAEYRQIKKLELEQLRLWEGKCTEIPLFLAEFDKLARRLYASETDVKLADTVLSEEYSKILSASDLDLWSRVCYVNVPTSLEEWKLRTVQANSTRKIVKQRKGEETKRGAGNHSQGKPNSTSAASMETGEGEERGEGQAESTLNAFPTKGGGGGKGKDKKKGERKSFFLTESEYQQLRAQEKCTNCYVKGHYSKECTKPHPAAKDRVHPTAEQLKA
jgi:hypothetical protein